MQSFFLINKLIQLIIATATIIATTQAINMSLQSDAVFQKIIDGVKENQAKAKAVNGVFLYKITKDGKVAKEWSKYILILITSHFLHRCKVQNTPELNLSVYLCTLVMSTSR